MKAVDILETTRNLVGGDRNVVHGDIGESFKRIASLWSEFLGTPITPEQVCWCMTLLKMARATSGTPVPDHYIDAAGYAALAGEVMQVKEKAPAVKQEPYTLKPTYNELMERALNLIDTLPRDTLAAALVTEHYKLTDMYDKLDTDRRKQHAGIVNYSGPRRRTTDLPYHYLGSEADLAYPVPSPAIPYHL